MADVQTELVIESPMGSLRLGATEKALTALDWTRSPAIPRAAEARIAHPVLKAAVAWLHGYFSSPERLRVEPAGFAGRGTSRKEVAGPSEARGAGEAVFGRRAKRTRPGSHRKLPPPPPLAPQGTPFQRAVWRELRRIPPGQTRSYGEIARAIKSPGAARGVGQACGANPLPIFIPCHRVLAASGQLGGFSAGLARKEWLLAHEGSGGAS